MCGHDDLFGCTNPLVDDILITYFMRDREVNDDTLGQEQVDLGGKVDLLIHSKEDHDRVGNVTLPLLSLDNPVSLLGLSDRT